MNIYQNNHQYDSKGKNSIPWKSNIYYIQIKREEKNKEWKQNLDILFHSTALYWSKKIF